MRWIAPATAPSWQMRSKPSGAWHSPKRQTSWSPWDSAGSLDSAERFARSAGATPSAHLSGALAYASEESDPRHIGPPQRAGAGSGSIRRRSLSATQRAFAGTAAAQQRGYRARTGDTRFSGNADRIYGTTIRNDHGGECGGRPTEDLAWAKS